MSEKARRWTFCPNCERIAGSPSELLAKGCEGERVEVAEVSKLREEWERKLLSDEAVARVARERFDYLQGYRGTRWEEAAPAIRESEERKARSFLKDALAATKEEK